MDSSEGSYNLSSLQCTTTEFDTHLKSAMKHSGHINNKALIRVSISHDESEIIDESNSLAVVFTEIGDLTPYSSDSAIVEQSVIKPTLDISTIIKKTSKTPEERKLERDKKKEEKLIRKFKREEEAKFRAIAESKCKRYVKYDSKIGEGGYKIVNRGFDRDTCRDIAWCEVKREHLDSKEKRQVLYKEIEIMMKLDHPNVVKCYAVLKEWWVVQDDIDNKRTDEKGLVYIEELMNEGTLKGMIKKNFQDGLLILENDLVTQWWYQILDVLRYMHSRMEPPIIHRDVKSDNLFLASQPNEEAVSVKIGDFGLATTINQHSQRKTMIGTIGFMAPEVYEEKYDIKVDIYAFGMMMLEVILNKTPYDDCTNIIQVMSKSISKHLSDIIGSISTPLIREIVMTCVHPFSFYRPSAEELCEHPIFQKAAAIVDPFLTAYDRMDTINQFVSSLAGDEISPIIGLNISISPEYVMDYSVTNDMENKITVYIDVYQTHTMDMYQLISALKDYIRDYIKIYPKRHNQMEKIYTSIRLQVQYLIRVLIGERWRAIFNSLLNKEPKDKKLKGLANMDISPVDKNEPNNAASTGNVAARIIDEANNNIGEGPYIGAKKDEIKIPNNFAEYSRNFSIYNKTARLLDAEIENYCQKTKLQKKPYFFNIQSNNKPTSYPLKREEVIIGNQSLGFMNYKNTEESIKDMRLPCESVLIENDMNDRSIAPEFSRSFCVEPVSIGGCAIEECNSGISSPYGDIQNEVFTPGFQNLESELSNLHSEPVMKLNIHPHFSQYEASQQRYLSEPSLNQALNYPHQISSTYPGAGCFGSANYTIHTEGAQNYQICGSLQHGTSIDQLNNPGATSFIQTYNLQTAILPGNNYYYQRHQQQQQQFLNFYQGHIPNSKVLFQPPLSHQTVLGGGTHCNCQSTCGVMHHNQTQQSNQIGNAQSNISNQVVRSLSNAVSTEYAAASIGVGPYSVTTLSTPTTTTNTSAIRTAPVVPNVSTESNMQQPRVVTNQQSSGFVAPIQKVSQSVVGGVPAKPNPVNVANPRSTLNTQEKTQKLKKSKVRLKPKCLLKVIDIGPSNEGETTVTFEMCLPMNQMRFTCNLSKELTTLDVTKYIKDNSQIPSELTRSEFLESLVMTVKKVCQSLLEDIKSVPLNEEYVFHPINPSQGLVKSSEFIQPQPLITSEIYDSNQSMNVTSGNSSATATPYSNPICPLISSNSQLPPPGSCASSRSLSRHPSNEDIINVTSFSQSPCTVTSNVAPTTSTSYGEEMDDGMTNKKWQPMQSPIIHNSGNLKVPEYLLGTVKQIVDKLQQPSSRGLIILNNQYMSGTGNSSQSSFYKVLELNPEYMFVTIPNISTSATSSSNTGGDNISIPGFAVVRCQKDRNFVITHKNVYQAPPMCELLLQANGDIVNIEKPSLVLPCKCDSNISDSSNAQKPQIIELYSDISQAVLQVKTVLQDNLESNMSDEAGFEEPIILGTSKKCGTDEIRRNSQDSAVSIPVTAPGSSQPIQVECLSFEYIPPNIPYSSVPSDGIYGHSNVSDYHFSTASINNVNRAIQTVGRIRKTSTESNPYPGTDNPLAHVQQRNRANTSTAGAFSELGVSVASAAAVNTNTTPSPPRITPSQHAPHHHHHHHHPHQQQRILTNSATQSQIANMNNLSGTVPSQQPTMHQIPQQTNVSPAVYIPTNTNPVQQYGSPHPQSIPAGAVGGPTQHPNHAYSVVMPSNLTFPLLPNPVVVQPHLIQSNPTGSTHQILQSNNQPGNVTLLGHPQRVAAVGSNLYPSHYMTSQQLQTALPATAVSQPSSIDQQQQFVSFPSECSVQSGIGPNYSMTGMPRSMQQFVQQQAPLATAGQFDARFIQSQQQYQQSFIPHQQHQQQLGSVSGPQHQESIGIPVNITTKPNTVNMDYSQQQGSLNSIPIPISSNSCHIPPSGGNIATSTSSNTKCLENDYNQSMLNPTENPENKVVKTEHTVGRFVVKPVSDIS